MQFFIAVYWMWIPPAGDEAIHIYNATRVASGEFPYVNFFSYLTPLTYLLGGVVVFMTEDAVLVLRVAMSALSFLAFFLFYKLLKTQFKPQERFALSLFLISYVAATVLTSTYFSHHNIDNTLFVAILFYAFFFKSNSKCIYGLSALIGIASLVHQAHGFAYFIGVVIYISLFLSKPLKARLLCLVKFLIPLVIIYSIFALFLYRADSIDQFINGSILWNLEVYAKKLAFSPFEDTVYYLKKGFSVEQYFFFATKTAIFISLTLLVLAISKSETRMYLRQNLLLVILIIAFIVSRTNTLANTSAYYVAVFALLGLCITFPKRSCIPILLVALLFVQIIRVFSFPLRYHEAFISGIVNLQPVGASHFYPGGD